MDLLVKGFLSILVPKVLLLNFIGVGVGIVVGALPGLTTTMAVAILVPLSFGMNPVSAFALLLGIYAGAVYGGSISAILIKTPGTPAACATIFDGYPLCQQGKAGEALAWATICSAIGGCIGVIFLIFLSPLITKFALRFSAPEYFGLAVFGLTIIISISGDDLVKGLSSGFLGILISTIGLDPIRGIPRFTFNQIYLLSGISLISALIGLFAVSEVLSVTEKIFQQVYVIKEKIKITLPKWSEIKHNGGLIIKSGIIGTFIGALPGAGADIAAFVAYNEAKRSSKTPERFGKGAIEGLIAPETANNAVTGGAMIPLLSLAIPGDPVTAVLLGALMIHGLRPGPLLLTENPEVVYSFFASLFVANIFLIFLGILGARYFVRVLYLSKKLLIPIILVLCIVGSYAVSNNLFDVKLTIIFGVLGYIMQKLNFPIAPVVLGIVLGPIAEVSMRQALIMSKGNYAIFFIRPISIVLLILAIICLYISFKQRKSKTEVISSSQDH